jgi:hypothetical protein
MAYTQMNNPIGKTGCGRRRFEQMDNPFKKTRTKTFTNPLTGRTRTVSKSGSIWTGNKSKSVNVSGGYKRSKSKTKYGLFDKNKSKPWKCSRNRKSC